MSYTIPQAFPVNPGRFTLNRAMLYAFSLCWWPSVMQPTPTGYTLIGLGPAAGFTLGVIVRPNVWTWSSNSYTLDYVFERVFYTDPGGGSGTAASAINVVSGTDPCNAFPLIRIRGGPFVGEVEHILPFPQTSGSFWHSPPGRHVALPRRVAIDRNPPCTLTNI